MKSLVEEASSIFKAIEKAWTRAGKPQSFSIKIFEEPEKNFLGFTKKDAKVGIFFEEAQPTQQSHHRKEHSRSSNHKTEERTTSHTRQQSQGSAQPQRQHSNRRDYNNKPHDSRHQDSTSSQYTPRKHDGVRPLDESKLDTSMTTTSDTANEIHNRSAHHAESERPRRDDRRRNDRSYDRRNNDRSGDRGGDRNARFNRFEKSERKPRYDDELASQNNVGESSTPTQVPTPVKNEPVIERRVLRMSNRQYNAAPTTTSSENKSSEDRDHSNDNRNNE